MIVFAMIGMAAANDDDDDDDDDTADQERPR